MADKNQNLDLGLRRAARPPAVESEEHPREPPWSLPPAPEGLPGRSCFCPREGPGSARLHPQAF